MIGNQITDETGKPLEQYSQLSPSPYKPNDEVMKLFERCQRDYQMAYNLQHRPFDEFDGMSVLQRTKKDQETFGAFVGSEYVPSQKRWRWKGRKNTARNKLIGILAHMLSGMLYPLVHAQNMEDEEDKLTAQVMRIIVEEHLRKAGYEMKFLYMVLSALVNPAVHVEVDYVIAYQRIKERLANGTYKLTEAIDEFMTGLSLTLLPVDEILPFDFYTNEVQLQSGYIRVKRISWDTARAIYGKESNFQYVEAGKTRVFLTGQEGQTLFDIEWTEADRNAVQILTFYYRPEDLEVTFVGGVFMGSSNDVYNTNPFKHRRMSFIGDEWKTIPIYPFAKSGFEPIDPTGRFYYCKSGAFKEYWDDATQNKMHQLLVDGTYLDVIKPLFISGLAKADSTIIAPGAVVGMPANGTVTPFQMGPNLAAAMNAMNKQEQDMSESTQDKIMSGVPEANITATQSIQAQNQAKIFLGVFGAMTADLVRQIGELTMDCIIMHTTQGEIDASVPESLRMKYKVLLAKSKDKGKDVTNKIVFTDAFMGRPMTEKEIATYSWALWDKAGGKDTDQRIHHVNPYRFARSVYSFYVNAGQMINTAMGNDRMQKITNHNMLTSPFVYPFTDPKAVADDVIEEFGGNDPDIFKKKETMDPNGMMAAVMGGQGMPSPIQPGGQSVGAAQKPVQMNNAMA